jgi:hypothetical protein
VLGSPGLAGVCQPHGVCCLHPVPCSKRHAVFGVLRCWVAHVPRVLLLPRCRSDGLREFASYLMNANIAVRTNLLFKVGGGSAGLPFVLALGYWFSETLPCARLVVLVNCCSSRL